MTHTVYAKIAADEEYRSFYGSTWLTTARNAMESADNAMNTEFGIDFVYSSSVSWDTSFDTQRPICGRSDGLLEELQRDVLRGSADVVVGFTKNSLLGSSHGCAGGNHALLHLHGSTSTARTYNSWVTLQHEFSHFYGAPDRYPDSGNDHQNDVMEDHYNYPDFWCEQPGYQDHGIVYAFRDKYD